MNVGENRYCRQVLPFLREIGGKKFEQVAMTKYYKQLIPNQNNRPMLIHQPVLQKMCTPIMDNLLTPHLSGQAWS